MRVAIENCKMKNKIDSIYNLYHYVTIVKKLERVEKNHYTKKMSKMGEEILCH